MDGMDPPPLYACSHSAGSESIDPLHAATHSLMPHPPLAQTLPRHHHKTFHSSSPISPDSFTQSCNPFGAPAMDVMHPVYSSTGKQSATVHTISKHCSSLDGSSKSSLPFRNNLMPEASSDFVSSLRDLVLNVRWKEWEGFSAFPVSLHSGGVVGGALGGVDSLIKEAKQAYGTATNAVKKVKRKLADAFSLNLQKPHRKMDRVANSINHVPLNSENPSAPTGTVAADASNANSARIATMASTQIIESQSSPPSPPLTATIPRNGHVVVHLRSRL